MSKHVCGPPVVALIFCMSLDTYLGCQLRTFLSVGEVGCMATDDERVTAEWPGIWMPESIWAE